MTGIILFLALLFGGIAIWAGMILMKVSPRKPTAEPRSRTIAPSPTDPWGALTLQKRERKSPRAGGRAF